MYKSEEAELRYTQYESSLNAAHVVFEQLVNTAMTVSKSVLALHVVMFSGIPPTMFVKLYQTYLLSENVQPPVYPVPYEFVSSKFSTGIETEVATLQDDPDVVDPLSEIDNWKIPVDAAYPPTLM